MLKKIKIISFEIGNECNLRIEHHKCPINHRKYLVTKFGAITPSVIINVISECQKLNFEGYYAFHFYNEPLLYRERIMQVISKKPHERYLLWTNGELLKENDEILDLFDKVVISCYKKEKLPFYKKLQKEHRQIEIEQWELDDRAQIYNRKEENKFGCKRVFFEIPIDYYGNIHLCCRDWNNSCKLGNILETRFSDILAGNEYKDVISNVRKRILDTDNCPEICKQCDEPWIRIPSGW